MNGVTRTARAAGLEYQITGAAHGGGDGDPVAVLLHGRGSHMGDLQGLGPSLPDGTTLVTPQAPHPGMPWGYGPGWAWYRYVREDQVVGETLQASLSALHGFLEALPDVVGFTPGKVFLGGFSQGGTTGMAYAFTHPGTVDGVLNFSGFVVNDPSVPLTGEAVQAAPIFRGHGVHDPAIAFALAQRGRTRLTVMEAPLTTGDYEIGHWIDPREMADAAAWMERVLQGA